MTVQHDDDDECPIDHTDDPDMIKRYYRTVSSYTLPRVDNINVLTVHR